MKYILGLVPSLHCNNYTHCYFPEECDKALMLYCHVLKDRAKAEEFCSKYYEIDKQVNTITQGNMLLVQ